MRMQDSEDGREGKGSERAMAMTVTPVAHHVSTDLQNAMIEGGWGEKRPRGLYIVSTSLFSSSTNC